MLRCIIAINEECGTSFAYWDDLFPGAEAAWAALEVQVRGCDCVCG
jgi:hypothetical protein